MATTIKQIESAPAAYPAVPENVGGKTWQSNTDAVWARLESYVSYRWTPRAVVWIVEGPGEWCPPLSPAEITTIEVWSNGASEWETLELQAAPLGYWLPATGPYRFQAEVGGGSPPVEVPASVNEAFKRLADYSAQEDLNAPAGASSYSENIGPLAISSTRNASWLAKAMQNSGAGDLLRQYRRAA